MGPQSDKLKIELAFLLSKYISDVIPRIVLSNRQSISSSFRYKDDLPSALRSGVLYKYSCPQCASCYIGSSCRGLHTRISEHA